jgi:hypothetical protein
MTLYRLQGATLPQESQGQVLPEYYGDLHRDIPGYPLQVGYAFTLADNCGADASQTTLKIAGPDLDQIFAALTLPVVADLEGEWLKITAYTPVPMAPDSITVQRAYGGTTAATHAKGATIQILESRPVYAFASAPPGCRYPDDAVVQLRINDVAQTPPCTLTLQDTRWIAGARLVTAEFDLTRYFGGMATPLAPRTLPIMAAGSPFQAAAPVATPPPVGVGHLQGPEIQPGDLMGGTLSPFTFPAAPVAPVMPRSVADVLGVQSQSPTVQLRGRSSPLGRLTMDLKGLLDTPAGRYTGTPSLALTEPSTIAACILESTFGETRRHRPTWAATRARHAALGLTSRVAWRGLDFEAFRAEAGFGGLADLWVDDQGFWRYTAQDRTAPVVATLTARELIGEIALGTLAPSATRLGVTWGEGLDAGRFELTSPDMAARYHIITERALPLRWAPSEAVARTVAREWFVKWDRERWTATAAVSPALAGLTRTDHVLLDTPLLAQYGRLRVPWEIRGTTDRGDQRVMILVEGDAIALEFSWSAAIRVIPPPAPLIGAPAALGMSKRLRPGPLFMRLRRP